MNSTRSRGCRTWSRRRTTAAALAALVVLGAVVTSLLQAGHPQVTPVTLELDGPGRNVDDPCFWVDPTDPAGSLVFVTTKGSGLVEVFNLATGAFVTVIPGFGRPNNCAVAGDLLLTTDRDAHEVKVHEIPGFALLRTFARDMPDPEGIDVLQTPEGRTHVYVTDGEDATVHVYDLDTGALVNAFASGFGPGIEPVLTDGVYQRVFVSREEPTGRGIGLFTPDGTFVQEFAGPIFSNDTEGLALYRCGDLGYLVVADQDNAGTQFEVFDRASLQHIGTFQLHDAGGEFTNATDGIDILQTPIPGFPNGLLAACDGCGSTLPDEMDVVAWERIADVMALDLCPNGEPADCAATPCIERLLPVADTSVDSAAPARNFGADPSLELDAGPDARVLLRFEVPDLTGFDLIRSTLRLVVDAASRSDSDAGGLVFVSHGAWAETEVTWDTRPAAVGEPLAGAGPIGRSEAVDFDVSRAVRGRGTQEFVLVGASTNRARFRSREAGESPPALLLSLHASARPVVTISSPAPGTVVPAGERLALSATAADAEDGDLSAAIAWRSDRAGNLGTGPTVAVSTLGIGDHTITAEALDRAGLRGTAAVRVRINTPPTIAIVAPADGAVLSPDDTVRFEAAAGDVEDGDLTASVAWVSDLDGALGTGSPERPLGSGTHTITASVTDSVGAGASTTVRVVVNAAPAVAVTAPAAGSVFSPGDAVTLAATATDREDGDLAAAVAWTSDLAGPLGTGTPLTTHALRSGTHTVTATVTDRGGKRAQAAIELVVNAAPEVAITAPAAGGVFSPGDTVTLAATARDLEDGDLAAAVTWTSDLAGPLGTGSPLATGALGSGIHTVTAMVTDGGGKSAQAAVSVVVNAAPEVAITGPADGAVFAPGDVVTFGATATDLEDGDLAALITWTSDLAGDLGAGVPLPTAALRSGTHTVTAMVTDRGGKSARAAISVVVNAAPEVAVMGPAAASVFSPGDAVTLTATATDREDGDLAAAVAWTSDLAGDLGAGSPFTTTALRSGTHTVTATVTDRGGKSARAALTLVVNAAPTIAITVPPSGAVFPAGDEIHLAAAATDLEDGDLAAAVTWTSDLAGTLGAGGSLVARALGVGTHVITAAVTDRGGRDARAEIALVVNARPVVTIDAPADGTSVPGGTEIRLAGAAADLEDGDLGTTLAWTSDRDGLLGTGTELAATLSEGTHVLAAGATDSEGAGGSAAVRVVIAPAPPVVAVAVPTLTVEGSPVLLAGTADDFTDGSLAGRLVWTSDLQGRLGDGAALVVGALAAGTHTITARATDSDGLAAEATARVRVVPPILAVEAVADTYVISDAPATNFGAADVLHVDTSPRSIAFLRFAVTGTAGLEIDRAVLRLTAATVRGANSESRGILHTLGDTGWDERTLTYATRPAIVGPGEPIPGGVAKGERVEVDVTGAVAGDGPVVFALTTALADAVKYQSREAPAGRPTLVLHLKSTHVLPGVAITAPPEGAVVPPGTPLTFEAAAVGPTLVGLAWTSDLAGPLGAGSPLTVPGLPPGVHTVRADATFAAGLRATARITVVADGAPAVRILSPADGAVLAPDTPVELAATATDTEDGDVSSTVTWVSSRDGALGTGARLTVGTLGPGPHTITATATDRRGSAGRASVFVTRQGGTLTLGPVADTYVSARDAATNFGASASLTVDADPERIALFRFALSGLGPTPPLRATLRLTAASASSAGGDDGGTLYGIRDTGWGETTVTWGDRPPLDGPVLARVGAIAPDDVVDLDVTPAVRGDGTVTFALASNSENGVTYRSRDALTGGPLLLLAFGATAEPPAVTILEPAAGTTVGTPTPLALRAVATDPEDGDLSATIEWRSDRDGPLGTGANLTASSLTPGTHVISATVRDTTGRSAEASVGVTVTAGALVFRSVADATVKSDDPVRAFGRSTTLQAEGSPARRAYLRFAVAGLSGARVLRATLRLTVDPAATSGSASGGTVHGITGSPWAETTVTFASSPPVDGPALATAGAVTAGQAVDFDVTGAVTGDGTHEFALVSASTDRVEYSSRETGAPGPQLLLIVEGQ
jgi:hypothetical protein